MTSGENIDHLREIASGDHDAFRLVFMKYFPRVKCFIAHIVKSNDDAEDLAQDIFLKIWMSREMLPDLRSFNAWIYRMARNSALNHLDHKYVIAAFAARPATAGHETTTPEDTLSARDMDMLIRIAVDRMPEQRRRIWVMSRDGNIKNHKIAEILGLTEKTVNNQISLALKEIQSVLAAALLFFV